MAAGVASLRDRPGGCDVVWVVHADTEVPATAVEEITRALADPAVVGGAFHFRLRTDGAGWADRRKLRIVTQCNRLRYRCSGIHFGDQAMFFRTAALDAVGGVPDLPILEDVELCRRLRRVGRLAVCPSRVTTSARRFLRHGVARQALRDWAILLRLRLGLSPDRLLADYNRDNDVGYGPEPAWSATTGRGSNGTEPAPGEGVAAGVAS